MKYNKRRNQSYKMPEMDKDYVLNNLDLAVRLLDEYGLENYKKPDFSAEAIEYLNKYGPKLKDIEGKQDPDEK